MSVSPRDQWVYVFGPFVLDPARRLLSRAGIPLSLSPKSFDLLFYLVENPDRVLDKEELFNAVWPGRVVEESNLSQTIFTLRKTLGATGGNESVIATSPGHGYRIAMSVRVVARDAQANVTESIASLGNLAAANAPELPAEDSAGHQQAAATTDSKANCVATTPPRRGRALTVWLLAAASVLILLAAGVELKKTRPPVSGNLQPNMVVLADFDNATGDTAFDGVLGRVIEIDLNQSPFLTILPQGKAQETLQLMGHAKDYRLTPEVAQEVCERNQAQAVVSGAIAMIGNRYLVTLGASDCNTGITLAEGKAEVSSKEGVLQSLDELTARIRAGVGESQASIRKFDVATTQATTSSFEALKAFSLGQQARARGDSQAALAFHKHATELDPSFAMAYLELSTIYGTLHEHQLSQAYLKKAFELRNRVSEHEKMRLDARYQASLGNTKNIIQSYKIWAQSYPQDWPPWANLTNLYTDVGEYPEAIEAGKQALRLMPDHYGPYYVLARAYERANQFDQAKAICAQATAKGLDGTDIHGLLYEIAFAEGDKAAMAAQVAKEAGQASEILMLNNEGFAAATSGQAKQARALFERAIAEAQKDGSDSSAETAEFFVNEIDTLVNSGMKDEARQVAAKAAGLEGNEFAPMVIAKLGDTERARALADALVKLNPSDNTINDDDIPTMRAAIDLQQGRPLDAIAELQPALPYELRNFELPSLLAQAYLDAQMPDRAAAEYRKIIANRGVDGLSILYPLAYLGLARAEARIGDKTASRTEYEHFFTSWKDADPDVPVLKQASREYSELQAPR
ncbi:MAG: winged helix-turn-helix domain-containing protein [Rudaea sp.]|nr:winged helix-turn-helix domain-containing protein [Rudaea sp.]